MNCEWHQRCIKVISNLDAICFVNIRESSLQRSSNSNTVLSLRIRSSHWLTLRVLLLRRNSHVKSQKISGNSKKLESVEVFESNKGMLRNVSGEGQTFVTANIRLNPHSGSTTLETRYTLFMINGTGSHIWQYKTRGRE